MADPLHYRSPADMPSGLSTQQAQGLFSDMWDGMHGMDKAALVSSPVPVLGDVMGLAADARMYAQEPESRTWGNVGLSALGALPFVPHVAGMAVPPAKQKELKGLFDKFEKEGPGSQVVKGYVEPTNKQREQITGALRGFWSDQDYPAIDKIDLRPKHAYDSRVDGEGFSVEEISQWLEAAGSDKAKVELDWRGRPALVNKFKDAERGRTYPVSMPLTSNSNGSVFAHGIIPKGLFGKKKP